MINYIFNQKINLFDIFTNKKKLADTNGPIPNAYITVPIPTIPPKYQPIANTLNSISVLVKEKDNFVIF